MSFVPWRHCLLFFFFFCCYHTPVSWFFVALSRLYYIQLYRLLIHVFQRYWRCSSRCIYAVHNVCVCRGRSGIGWYCNFRLSSICNGVSVVVIEWCLIRLLGVMFAEVFGIVWPFRYYAVVLRQLSSGGWNRFGTIEEYRKWGESLCWVLLLMCLNYQFLSYCSWLKYSPLRPKLGWCRSPSSLLHDYPLTRFFLDLC